MVATLSLLGMVVGIALGFAFDLYFRRSTRQYELSIEEYADKYGAGGQELLDLLYPGVVFPYRRREPAARVAPMPAPDLDRQDLETALTELFPRRTELPAKVRNARKARMLRKGTPPLARVLVEDGVLTQDELKRVQYYLRAKDEERRAGG